MNGKQIVQMAADLATGKFNSVSEAMRGNAEQSTVAELLAALNSIADQVSDAVNHKIQTGRMPPIGNLLSCIEDTARQAIADHS